MPKQDWESLKNELLSEMSLLDRLHYKILLYLGILKDRIIICYRSRGEHHDE